MLVSYDPEVDIAVLYLTPTQALLEGGEEVTPGVILHYDREGRLGQIELLEASTRYPRETLEQYSVPPPTPVAEEDKVEWAFQVVMSDPAFKLGTSLKAPGLGDKITPGH
jgi:uncharacterized protein YuzE